jgi:hypothetical protein
MSSNIYAEALVEAKKLREIAEENAKSAIIEAVTPKIREFIDSQLMESGDSVEDKSVEDIISEAIGLEEIKTGEGRDDVSEDEEVEEVVELDESALQMLASMLGSNGGDDILSVLAESINSLDSESADLVKSAARKIAAKNESFSSKEINNDVKSLQENNNMASNEKVYEVDLALLREELDMEEGRYSMEEAEEEVEEAAHDAGHDDVVKEVLRDLGLLNEDKIEIDLGDDVELPEDIMLTARLVEDEDEGDDDLEVADEVMDVEEDEGEGEADDEAEVALDEVFEIDPDVLKEELNRIKRLVREAKSLADEKGGADSMEAHFGGSGHANAGQKHQFGGKSGKGGSAFGGGSESGDAHSVKINALAESLKKEQRKNRALQERLEEYRSAVETLREQLTDLNLFNAKLLYVNKLFQDKSVNPSRRKSMVESIDAAKSLREVKLIYKTLTSGNTDAKRLNESTSRTLGSSSRPVGRSSATATNTEVDRWATLAGIK